MGGNLLVSETKPPAFGEYPMTGSVKMIPERKGSNVSFPGNGINGALKSIEVDKDWVAKEERSKEGRELSSDRIEEILDTALLKALGEDRSAIKVLREQMNKRVCEILKNGETNPKSLPAIWEAESQL